MKIKHYLLNFLKDGVYHHPIPGLHFWAVTLLIVRAGVEIEMEDGHVLTPKDCFVEIEDIFLRMSGDNDG